MPATKPPQRWGNINIDKTPPAPQIVPSGTPGGGGWFVSDVAVVLTPSDNLSGVAVTDFSLDGGVTAVRYTGPLAITQEGPPPSRVVRIDKTPPAITYLGQSPQPNAAGWNKTNVTLLFSCSDAASGIATCTSPLTAANEGQYAVTARAVDFAGFQAFTDVSVKIDKTPPTTAISVFGEEGQASWFVGNVKVMLQANDGLSGLAGTEYSLDGGTVWQPYGESFFIKAEGGHKFVGTFQRRC